MTNKEVVKTGADTIWEDIQNRSIEMFALPNQKVKDHVEKLLVPGDNLYVKLVSSAALASLEVTIADKYEVEMAEKYVIIKHKTPEISMAVEKAPVAIIGKDEEEKTEDE